MTQYQPPHINRKLNVQTWWLTALLILINVSLFVWQIATGVDISDPAMKDAIHWGLILHHLLLLGSPNAYLPACFFILVLFTSCLTCGPSIFSVM